MTPASDAGSPVPRPIRERARQVARGAREWLLGSDIVEPDGSVLSWLNPAKPGYAYPEIMGYYLGFAAAVLRTSDAGDAQEADRARERGARVAGRLAEIAGAEGSVGRAGTAYVFDTCIAINGLVDLARATQADPHRATIASMADFVERSLRERTFALVAGRPAPDPDSWSLTFGASALKCALALDRAAEHLERPALALLAAEVARAAFAATWTGSWFRINPERDWAYAHAHCYALEGLLYLECLGRVPSGIDARRTLRAGTAWLAQRQNADGSLTGWHGRPGAPDDHQGDATSQSVRLWRAVDPEAYADAIARGLSFLAGRQGPAGGLYYNAGSQDVNSWVTMFAWQAAQWVACDAPELPDVAGVL